MATTAMTIGCTACGRSAHIPDPHAGLPWPSLEAASDALARIGWEIADDSSLRCWACAQGVNLS